MARRAVEPSGEKTVPVILDAINWVTCYNVSLCCTGQVSAARFRGFFLCASVMEDVINTLGLWLMSHQNSLWSKHVHFWYSGQNARCGFFKQCCCVCLLTHLNELMDTRVFIHICVFIFCTCCQSLQIRRTIALCIGSMIYNIFCVCPYFMSLLENLSFAVEVGLCLNPWGFTTVIHLPPCWCQH